MRNITNFIKESEENAENFKLINIKPDGPNCIVDYSFTDNFNITRIAQALVWIDRSSSTKPVIDHMAFFIKKDDNTLSAKDAIGLILKKHNGRWVDDRNHVKFIKKVLKDKNIL